MTEKMFCFQCEQTAGCTGCRGNAGVCGKQASTACLQDELTGAMIDLARCAVKKGLEVDVSGLLIAGLFTTVTNVNFNDETLRARIGEVKAKTREIGGTERPTAVMEQIWHSDEDLRSLQSLILFGLRGMAAYAWHARVLGRRAAAVDQFFAEGLAALVEEPAFDTLLPLALKVGEVNLKCMELLDSANVGTYGSPVPTTVPLTVEKGPFIVVTGHDLKDLEELLRQTEGRGVDVYTHGEMLPAHAYPKLKAYPHLKGNFGTAWQNQQKEFDSIPGAVLFTTNCLMPPKPSYGDRVFTTALVSYPGIVHVGEDRDFSPLVAKALELGGYSEDRHFRGVNGGTQVTTGFGHDAVLAAAGTVIDAVKSGALRHIFLVGGCDGAKPGRNYYTEFVKKTPADTLVLTLACGKYRFNDLDLGTLGGLPRILDMGQCNDAYSAIAVASALAKAFNCGVNDLPLTMVLSWYEQKAVCILLTLLHLGVKNILLGPTLPAFLSPKVLDFLIKNYNIGPISTPEPDLAKILNR